MLSFLGCFEHALEHIVFTLGNGALGHGESNSELLGSNVARSQPVEIPEELRDTDALLLAKHTDSSDDIVLIIGTVTHDFGLTNARLSLGEVVSAVVEALTDSKQLISTIDVLAEIYVVDFINIALVHVSAEDSL